MKELLADEEDSNPQLFKSLLSTMRPLMEQGMPEEQEIDRAKDTRQAP
jgi:recombinational DNA repair protein (RecF pathway)